jgi:hypothetical protein
MECRGSLWLPSKDDLWMVSWVLVRFGCMVWFVGSLMATMLRVTQFFVDGSVNSYDQQCGEQAIC